MTLLAAPCNGRSRNHHAYVWPTSPPHVWVTMAAREPLVTNTCLARLYLWAVAVL